MKTDKLFYRLFLSQPSLITELIPEIPLDCEFTYSAPVIKEKGFAIDGLLTPVEDDPNALVLAQSILNTADTDEEMRRRLDLVEAILVNKFPQLSTEEILKMLNLKTADIKETRFYQEVLLVGLEEGRQEGRQKGRQEGRQEGLQEGRQEEAANLVIRLLTRRCGSLSSSLEIRVRSLLVNQLEMLGEDLLDFSDIKDLENWLAAIS